MYNVSNKKLRVARGFTLIEALASVTILGLGIASVVGGLGSVSKTEARMKRIEAMTRLAQHKFDELVATSTSLSSASTQSGDFKDENNNDYLWSAQVEDTGVTNLEALTITVTLADDSSNTAPTGIVSSLIYVPPVSTTTTTTTGGGTRG
jgi:prepilin-type N-terminal cleavage/methylation domain-containing protein